MSFLLLLALWPLSAFGGAPSTGQSSAQQSSSPASAKAEDVEALLIRARSQVNAHRSKDAIGPATEAIGLVADKWRTDLEALRQYAEALALRGGAYVQTNQPEKAKDDFKLLLSAVPGYVYPAPAGSPRFQSFSEVKQATVGELQLSITPPEAVDAVALLDGKSFSLSGPPVALVAGTYQVSVKRPGYAPVSTALSVQAGRKIAQVIALDRTSGVVRIFTAPAGVEVYMSGQLRGRTEPGPPARWGDAWSQAFAGLRRDEVSAEFVLDPFDPGDTLELKRPCYADVTHSLNIWTEKKDYLGFFKLNEAKGTVAFEGPAGARVAVDGQRPLVLPIGPVTLCEGKHSVIVSTDSGTDARDITVRADGHEIFRANPLPAIAILYLIPTKGYVGTDARHLLAEKLTTSSLLVTAPDPAKISVAFGTLKDRDQIAIGGESPFLDYDRYLQPVSEAAQGVTGEALLLVSRRLADTLGAQGIAQVKLVDPGGDKNQFRMTILAGGSSIPDVLEVDLANPESVRAARADLDEDVRLFEPSVGLTVADIADVGVVVTGVAKGGSAEKAGIHAGDVIRNVGTDGVGSAREFRARLQAKTDRDKLTLVVSDLKKRAAPSAAQLDVTLTPRVIAASDMGRRFNVLILRLRARLETANAREAPIARLNLAVALMAVRNWREALAELNGIDLPSGAGISRGTVEYLKADCLNRDSRFPEARVALAAALSEPESLLTENGPPIKELAEALKATLK